jgi:hypothetical protein
MPTATAEIEHPRNVAPLPLAGFANAWRDAAAIALGCALTLAIHGYRFGEGNHTIYLLDALRSADPELLRNDWFTTRTLQYHAVFGWIAHRLIALRAIEPVFLAGYLLLVTLFHVACLGIVKALGGGRGAYLVSLALYYASAAGTGLGMYQFFQDSSLLPSNVANVAMLGAVVFWIRGRFAASGACLGVAGLFHLNHAVVGVVMWVVLCLLEAYSTTRIPPFPSLSLGTGRRREIAVGSLFALAPALVNIVLAARVKLAHAGGMPLVEFVDLYVRLRHPHHYDPSSWPVGLWVSFLWPLPFAFMLLRRADAPIRRAAQVFVFVLVLQVVALLGAGVWYVSESLVQMSLYRFSIFVQLLACVVVAIAIGKRVAAPTLIGASAAACWIMIATCLIRGPFFGAFVMPGDEAEYLAVCDWARDHTPVDAVFLVPPGESSFRLRARRAIVVNFKAVPQLSGELPEWRDRLQAALALDDLTSLPWGYVHTLRAIDQRYASLDADQLVAAATAYDARYVVTARACEPRHDLRLVFSSPTGGYFVYDRAPPLEEQPE